MSSPGKPAGDPAGPSPLSPRRPLVWIWGLLWLLGVGWTLANVGIFDTVHPGVFYGDIHLYSEWAKKIVETGALPHESTWQYPPGAAYVFLVPHLFAAGYGAEYSHAFVAFMLAFDLCAVLALVALGRQRGNYTGVWVWLLVQPTLTTLPVLRFDVVPTALAIAALVVIHRRPRWFGALAGIGGMIKIWPLLVLFGEWDRRRLLESIAAALVAIVVILAISVVAFGDPFTFVGEQGGRGLQVEAVAAAPWQLRQVVTGTPIPEMVRNGAYEIPSGAADAVAKLLDLVALAALAAAVAWWALRERAIRGGRTDLASETVARDFVFTIVLLFVVTSRVLSPQYMVWLLGLAAVVLTGADSRLRRPAWIVLAAIAFTASIYDSPNNMLMRNLALLFATADACLTLWLLLRRPPAAAPAAVPARSAPE